DAPQAVDLVYEEDVAILQRVREDRGQIAWLLDGRARRHTYAYAHLVRDDVGEGGLAQPGRAVQQQVVEGLPPVPRRFQVDGQLLLQSCLTDVLRQGGRAQTNVLHDAQRITALQVARGAISCMFVHPGYPGWAAR